MKFTDAAEEYVEATRGLPSASEEQPRSHRIAEYIKTASGKHERTEVIVSPEQIAVVLAHFRMTLIMTGLGRYRTLEV